MKSPPLISNDLIKYLEQTFPITQVLSSETQDQLWFYKGIHSVLEHLKVVKDYQDKQGTPYIVQRT